MKDIKAATAPRQQGISTAEIVTYVLIAMVIPAVIFGLYQNNRLSNAIAAALALGEEQKVLIEDYFGVHGQMPQNEADAGLDSFLGEGVLEDLDWVVGAFGEGATDTLVDGTLKAVVDLSEFGERFEEIKSGYLLIARGQEDGTIVWDCMADSATPSDLALPSRYLPESCERSSDTEEDEED